MADKPHHYPMDQAPIGMLINDASKFFHDRMRREAEKLGIRDGYRQMLFYLARNDGVTQLDLVRSCRLKPPTVSVTLKKMEDEGYVLRETDPGDLRQVRVFITKKGKQLNRQIHERVEALEQLFCESLAPEEQRELRRLLLKMRAHYEQSERG